MNQLTDEQLVLLDNIIYLNLTEYKGLSLRDTLGRIIEEDESFFIRYTEYKDDNRAGIEYEDWIEMCKAFLNNDCNDSFLDDYKLDNYTNNEDIGDYFSAGTFVKRCNETVDDIVVVFRGTSEMNLNG